MPNNNISTVKLTRLKDEDKLPTASAIKTAAGVQHTRIQYDGGVQPTQGAGANRTTSGGLSLGGAAAAASTGRPTPGDTRTDSFDHSSPYYFYGSMSEEVLHRYLDRALEADIVSNPYWFDVPEPNLGENGPSYKWGYSPLDPYPADNVPFLFDPHYDHRRMLDMIINTGAKLVTNMCWINTDNTAPWNPFEYTIKTFQHDCEWLHSKDPEIIIGVAIAEWLPKSVLNVPIPPYEIVHKFYPSGRPSGSSYFDPSQMFVPAKPGSGLGSYNSHIDLSKSESQMWYYYLATRFIDAGCENIHFGDLFIGCCRNDEGNRNLWWLMELIREYARTHARRKLVLLDTHCVIDRNEQNYDKPEHYLYAWYYDPDPVNPAPDWKRQLIFDFHSLGAYYVRNPIRQSDCEDGPHDNTVYNIANQSAVLPVILKWGHGLLNRSKGGRSPLGWYCSHNPNLVHFDQGGGGTIYMGSACDTPDKGDTESTFDNYYFDNTSWFIRQQPSERRAIIIYTYYKIKCLDPYSHFAMPGRHIYSNRYYVEGGYNDDLKHTYDFFNSHNVIKEEQVIKNTWQGVYTGPDGWSLYNFTLNNVANCSDFDLMPKSTLHDPDITNIYPLPESNLIRAGADKMYFISYDNNIRGYVHIDGTYNGGDWIEVDVRLIARDLYGTDTHTQVKPRPNADCMAASPDGRTLLYIGVDGYIYGYKVHSNFDYEYFSFMKAEMQAQNITAVGCLIYPTTDSIYYIASYPSYLHENRIHGFQKSSGVWQTTSPTYSAYNNGQSMESQARAGGALTYVQHPNYNRINYKDEFGYLCYYEIRSLINFYFYQSEANWDLHGRHIRIAGRLAACTIGTEVSIYFVGHNIDGNTNTVYCARENGSARAFIDVRWAAGVDVVSYYAADIAVSPDGKNIIFFPSIGNGFYPLRWLACYYTEDGTNYHYYEMSHQETEHLLRPGNSLTFVNNQDFLYIGAHISENNSILQMKYGECYCNNSIIEDYEN